MQPLAEASASAPEPGVAPEIVTQPAAEPEVVDVRSPRTAFIEEMLTGRKLEPIEGLWVHNDTGYEIGIAKSASESFVGFDFTGTVISAPDTAEIGKVLLGLRKTGTDSYYPSEVAIEPKMHYLTSVFLQDPNVMEFYAPRVPGAEASRQVLTRCYPAGGAGVSAESSGTGFFIAPGIVVTSYRVVQGADSLYVGCRATGAPATLIMRDKLHDIAILQTSYSGSGDGQGVPSGGWLELGDSDRARVGERIVAVGIPSSPDLGEEPEIVEGTIANVEGIGDDATLLQFTPALTFGTRGGPLLDAYGRVIGVMCADDAGGGPASSFAVKVSYLKALVPLLPVDMESGPKTGGTGNSLADLVVPVRAVSGDTAM
jgi:S1-C subfamily serine protease